MTDRDENSTTIAALDSDVRKVENSARFGEKTNISFQ